MSHFSVIVVGDNVEEQLQPYHEYECTGIVDQYVIDVDKTEEARVEYKGDKEDNYPTFEEFAKEWYGESALREDGRVVTRTNPNAKWDWWVVGGRWSGWLGKDQGLRSEFNLDELRTKAALEAQEDYRKTRPEGIEPPDAPWSQWRERYADVNEAREAWWGHPFCAAIKEGGTRDRLFFLDPSDYIVDEVTFMHRAHQRAVVPYALVAEGAWKAKGEMGWFGMSNDSTEEAQWCQFVNQFLDDMPGNMQLTLVDCHI